MTAQRLAVDPSVAVPLLVASHEAHRVVATWAAGRSLSLSGHALAETYSLLTRLPSDARVTPADAVVLIDENFVQTLVPSAAQEVHREFARRGGRGRRGLRRAHGVDRS